MALAPINPTNLTPPRVEFIDPRTGAISREWYRFFLSLLTATQANQEETALSPDTSAMMATYDAMLASATQASAVTSDGMVASLESSLNSLQNAFGVTPPDLGGTVTSVTASGGTTGLTFTGSPITTSGTLTLGGTLGVANGGTGQTSYTDGQLLIGNSTGSTLTKATLIAGTNITITNGAGSITIASTAGTGTVTSVSVVSANGFAGTVATATTTPAITISTSVTGLVKGNGTALSAAVAATDYVAPSAYASANGLTMATSRLLGRTTASTGAAEEISVAGGLTLSAGVLTGASGTVTSVTGTSPVVSSGGATPAISMPAATTSVNGYLTSTDWTTFNNKGSGTVTSVTGTAPVVSSGGATPAISMAAATTSVNGYLTSTDWNTFNGKQATLVSGTNIKTVGGVSLLGAGDVGTIGATYGGTGQSSYAVGDILYASTTTALSKLADVATGNALISGGVGVAPSYGKIGLTTHISGTLAVGNGGTGATTLTSGYLVKGNGTSAVSASLVYDTGTNVGISTTSPTTTLQIGDIGASDATYQGRVKLEDAPSSLQQIGGLEFATATFGAGYGWKISSIDPGGGVDLVFGTRQNSANWSEIMRIDRNGNVGIGATANASALLDVQSTTKGFRLPNMTTVQKNAIGSPAAGLMVFDTTLAKACVYSGAAWQTITSL
jgi:hypothetical protein